MKLKDVCKVCLAHPFTELLICYFSGDVATQLAPNGGTPLAPPFQTEILLKYCQSCLIRFHQTCFLLFCRLLSRTFFVFIASLDFALILSVKASNKRSHDIKKKGILRKKKKKKKCLFNASRQVTVLSILSSRRPASTERRSHRSSA